MVDGGHLTSENIAKARAGRVVNKYGVALKADRTYKGVVYASKLEAKRARDLDLMVWAGEIRFWIRQPEFRLGCPENVYKADFLVVGLGARVWVEDVKGVRTPKFQRDKRLWRKYGPCDLRIITKHGMRTIEPEEVANG